MIAKFTRGSDGRLGIRFEPETFEEQLLLEIFTRNAESLGHEFRFSSWEQHKPGRAMREGLTSTWGEIVARESKNPRSLTDDPEPEALHTQHCTQCGWSGTDADCHACPGLPGENVF